MYLRCMDDDSCGYPRYWDPQIHENFWLEKNYPVYRVSHEDARNYCEWAGRRLPEENEWIKAALGSEGLIYPWGNVYSNSAANTMGGAGLPLPVGTHERDVSPFGVYDMAGNVSEWVRLPSDYYAARGGDYLTKVKDLRQAMFDHPNITVRNVGFRCAMSADDKRALEPTGEAASQISTPSRTPVEPTATFIRATAIPVQSTNPPAPPKPQPTEPPSPPPPPPSPTEAPVVRPPTPES